LPSCHGVSIRASTGINIIIVRRIGTGRTALATRGHPVRPSIIKFNGAGDPAAGVDDPACFATRDDRDRKVIDRQGYSSDPGGLDRVLAAADSGLTWPDPGQVFTPIHDQEIEISERFHLGPLT
jgi:hypothetical protein